jgi:hypothetical protein
MKIETESVYDYWSHKYSLLQLTTFILIINICIQQSYPHITYIIFIQFAFVLPWYYFIWYISDCQTSLCPQTVDLPEYTFSKKVLYICRSLTLYLVTQRANQTLYVWRSWLHETCTDVDLETRHCPTWISCFLLNYISQYTMTYYIF